MTIQPSQNVVDKTERRYFQRKKFRARLEVEWGSATLTGEVRDIGPRGLFVELTPPLWMGARFHGHLILKPPVKLECTVARVEPEAGFAVIFDVADENGKAQLEALLVSLPPA